MVSDEVGIKSVLLARRAVESYLESQNSSGLESNDYPIMNSEDFDGFVGDIEERGVFITINSVVSQDDEQLRGCIGYPIPKSRLGYSIIDSAIAAATQDPRFPPVSKEELGEIIFEVSILTIPKEIKVSNPKDYLNIIEIGRDGLILNWKFGAGLLLPQVPVELKWDVEEYLANLCYKAGAPPDTWLMPESKILSFQADIFKESRPNGSVVKVKLK
jgi:uncharacterized protein (TIGR00296 family)